MINLFLAPVITKDRLREAEKTRFMKNINRRRKTQGRLRLAKLACRFELLKPENGRSGLTVEEAAFPNICPDPGHINP